MELNKLEKYIEQLFNNHEAPLDTDTLWENIEGRLDKKRHRRRFLIVLLFGLGLAGWLFHASGDKPSGTETLAVQKNIPSPEKPKIRQAVSPATKESIAESSGQKELKTNTEKTGSLSLVTLTEDYIKKPDKSVRSVFSEPKESIGNLVELQAEGTVLTEDQKRLKAKMDLAAKPLEAKMPEPVYLMHSPYPSVPEHINQKRKHRKPKKAKRKRKKYKWTKSFDFYLSPDIAFRHMEPNLLLLESVGYARDRKATEKSLEAFSAGTDFKLMSPGNFILLSGLEVKQVNERFEFNEYKEESTDVTGFLTITVNAFGDTTHTTSGLVNGIVISERKKVTYNHYRSFNFPIGIGYQFQQKNYDIELLGGVDINLGLHRKGEILSRTGGFMSIDSRNTFSSSAYKKRTGMSLWAGCNMVKRFEKLTLFGGPYFRYSLKPMTDPGYVIDHKYTTLGCRLGARVFLK